MALMTSGTISMADIHVEAAGSPYASSGTSSLNDADIRALNEASGYTINNTAGTTISIGDFYGASSTITNAYSATGANQQWGKGSRRRVGRVITSYYVGGAQGSGGTPSPLSTDGFGMSLTCKTAAWYEGPSSSGNGFRWEATGSSNSASTTWWNKVTISRSGQTDVVLLRSNATTNAMTNYRYSIFWPSLYVNYICNGAFTWTFSS